MNLLTEPSIQAAADQRILLYAVGWSAYDALLRELGDRRGIRLTFDRGNLEIMVPSFEHEEAAGLLGRFLEILTEELNIPLKAGGSTTFRRQDLDRGLEPDCCYYLQHASDVRGLRRIDLTRDPPPDLAIEVEVTRSALNRLGIYAAFGVPEVWRYDGDAIHVHRLRPDRTYEEVAQSVAFPFLPLAEVVAFVHRGEEMDDTALAKAFRGWVRRIIPSGPGSAGPS